MDRLAREHVSGARVAALVGHPQVIDEDGEETAMAVKRVCAGFSASPAGESITLEPIVDGARFSPRLLAPLLEVFAPNEPLLVLEPEHGVAC